MSLDLQSVQRHNQALADRIVVLEGQLKTAAAEASAHRQEQQASSAALAMMERSKQEGIRENALLRDEIVALRAKVSSFSGEREVLMNKLDAEKARCKELEDILQVRALAHSCSGCHTYARKYIQHTRTHTNTYAHRGSMYTTYMSYMSYIQKVKLSACMYCCFLQRLHMPKSVTFCIYVYTFWHVQPMQHVVLHAEACLQNLFENTDVSTRQLRFLKFAFQQALRAKEYEATLSEKEKGALNASLREQLQRMQAERDRLSEELRMQSTRRHVPCYLDAQAWCILCAARHMCMKQNACLV